MTDGDPNEPQPEPTRKGVGRRAVLGGALGAAAAGIVGYEVGAAGASDEPAPTAKAAPADASAVAVAPKGELIADDVQTALVDVYDRTSALARLHDLMVAYEVVDDFPPNAAPDQVGSLGWQSVTQGAGATVEGSAPLEGGIVRLSTGATAGGRAAIHLGLDQHSGAPVFTMQWRLRLEALPAATEGCALAFGALASVTADPTGPAIGPGMFWAFDPSAGPTWRCRAVTGGELVDIDAGRVANEKFHRFTITSDGDGLARFSFDEVEVASIPLDREEPDRYGQGFQLVKTGGSTPVVAEVDWFYLRRELPR